jgi:predicted transposase/invertase (TIGR01784 family)
MRRTLDPKLDIVFKLLFADERNTALLISLLTAVLKPAHPITEVVLLNPEIERSAVLEKGAVLDVRVRLKDGAQVDIEMQAAP